MDGGEANSFLGGRPPKDITKRPALARRQLDDLRERGQRGEANSFATICSTCGPPG
jgi:hypothetical protein